jgi:hypothetical protein
MTHVSKGLEITSRICGATLLAAFAATAFGHNNEPNPTDKPLVWVDSKGKTIGRAVGEHGVQITVNGLALIVPVGNRTDCPTPKTCTVNLDIAWGGEFSAVLFSGKDCKGDAYIGTPTQPGSARAVSVVGNTLYIGANSPASLVPLFSQKTALNGCFDFGSSFPILAWKVVKKVNVDWLPYKPPFYLK